jgi:hypothetical protein
MPLILRSTKGSPLTFNELDGNFTYLSESIASGSGGGTPATASYALTATSASYANNASTANSVISASYALSASYAPAPNPFPYIGNAVFSGSVFVSGSIVPNVDGVSTTSSFSLGSPTAAWKDIYVSDGTINFLDSAGNVQGTIGAGTNATVITGSLKVVQPNPLTTFATNGTQLHRSYTSADCAFKLARTNSPYTNNPQLYTNGSDNIILPWDKKITAYSIINNLRVGLTSTSPTVCLPPIYNTGLSVGETITVYNLGTTVGPYKATGSLFIAGFAGGVTSVDENTKTVTGTSNTGYILSGSYGNYTYVSTTNNATTESIKINPGQKATFEVVYWGTFAQQPSASANGFSENGYNTNYTNVNASTVYLTYLFKGIENL